MKAIEKLIEDAAKNIKVIASLLVVALVAGAAYTGYIINQQSKESEAFGKLASLEKSWGEWKTQTISPPNSAKSENQVDPQILFNDLQSFSQKYSDLQAGQLAALMMSEVGSSLKKEDELLSYFEKQNKKSNGQLLTALSVLKKGDLQANQNQCEVAIKTWEPLLKQKNQDYLADLAHLKMGLCYEKLNQKDKAISHYEAVITMKSAKPERWAHKEAQKFKRALQWSQN
jgi:tetratricopeptide (TPR) repeat protein